jgi:large subunit ribosomal protein L15
MSLHDLHPSPGSRKARKRKGRGIGSGNGKTAGKGHKGQKARAGGSTRLGFEGGQMPLYRRLPKRGFNNARFRTEYDIVNLCDLADQFSAGETVNTETLVARGMLKPRPTHSGLKVLGTGELGFALTVEAAKFSASAVAKIEAAGGRAVVLGGSSESEPV